MPGIDIQLAELKREWHSSAARREEIAAFVNASGYNGLVTMIHRERVAAGDKAPPIPAGVTIRSRY